MAHVNSFRELEVYKLARQLSHRIFLLTKDFPRDEKYSLTDQIRRSSRSVGAQIAEAWAKRRYENHFISKLTDADGEQQETQHWLETASDCDLLSKSERDHLISNYEIVGKMMYSMINKASTFCR